LKGLIVEGLVTLYSLGWINNLGLRDTLLSVRFHFLFISSSLLVCLTTVTDEHWVTKCTGDFVGMFVDAQAKILPVGHAYNSA